MDKRAEEINQIVREEVHKEFDIPVICPPNNRVSDDITKRILALFPELSVEGIEKILKDWNITEELGFRHKLALALSAIKKELLEKLPKPDDKYYGMPEIDAENRGFNMAIEKVQRIIEGI